MESVVWEIIIGALAGIVTGIIVGVALAHFGTVRERSKQLEVLNLTLATIQKDMSAIKQEGHADKVLFSTKLDEIRRRIIAVEQKTHGFNLDGVPVIKE